jgi:hypothetical protein
MAKKATKTAPLNFPLATNYIHVYQGKIQKVNVGVHINYATGQITLIDPNPSNPKAVQGKQWVFANRTVEFMAGWHDILDAMKSAIADATEKIEVYMAAQEDEVMDCIC